MAQTKAKIFNENEKTILSVLASANAPMTLAQINPSFVSGNINGLVKGGYVAKGDQVVVEAEYVDTVKTYAIGSATPTDSDKLTEKAKQILDFIRNNAGLTLNEISERIGFKVVSGNVNGLVGKNFLDNSGEKETVRVGKKKVSTYVITELGQSVLA